MSAEKEERACIKFCVKLGKNRAESFQMLKTAFGDECFSHADTLEWFKKFKEGQTTVDDHTRCGRLPSRSDYSVTCVRELIRVNRRLPIRENSPKVGMSYGKCQAILTEDLTCDTCLRNSFLVSLPSSIRNSACLPPLISFKRQERIRTSWKASSQVTRHGFTDTIRKRHVNLRSGIRRSIHNRRKRVRCARK
ncbi:hypothetical protein Cfor_09829 [Coptotermes formosanus]|uniref:Mos1 transposase HTH domain-containing protein n=1 Tax=Coptotermes formosanus TaxID=36987 RepID=A0A6L2Q5P8_COPFO|nr:hypothetical protein Cfor_09829 [Coptotermes formosanus]